MTQQQGPSIKIKARNKHHRKNLSRKDIRRFKTRTQHPQAKTQQVSIQGPKLYKGIAQRLPAKQKRYSTQEGSFLSWIAHFSIGTCI